jgi:hypothetical protein
MFEIYNYSYAERSGGREYHLMENSTCIWCSKFIPQNGGLKINIEKKCYWGIPYCSNKCRSEDPKSEIYIELFIHNTNILKENYLKDIAMDEARKESKLNEELIAYSKKKKILNLKLIFLALIILATLYLINGMNIVGYFFGLLLFLIVRSLNTISKPSSYN